MRSRETGISDWTKPRAPYRRRCLLSSMLPRRLPLWSQPDRPRRTEIESCRRERPEVPDYLRSQRRSRFWPIAITALLAACLLVAVDMALWGWNRDRPTLTWLPWDKISPKVAVNDNATKKGEKTPAAVEPTPKRENCESESSEPGSNRSSEPGSNRNGAGYCEIRWRHDESRAAATGRPVPAAAPGTANDGAKPASGTSSLVGCRPAIDDNSGNNRAASVTAMPRRRRPRPTRLSHVQPVRRRVQDR